MSAEKDEEFSKLYHMLRSLSSKTGNQVNTPHVTPMISLMDIPMKTLVIDTDENKESATKEHDIKETSVILTPISEYSSLSHVTSVNKIDINTVSCDACLKTFPTTSALQSHVKYSEMCTYWNTLPNKKEFEIVPKSIHVLVDELLSEAITVKGTTTQCQFCKTTFSTKGNLHKHFHHAIVCNRMAYVQLKKVVAALA